MLQDVIDALRRRSPDALTLARAEVAAAPGNAEAHHLLGLALRNAGDMDSARASLDTAIELAPGESAYHASRALLARAEGDLATADRISARALELDPNLFDAYLLRTQLAIARGDFSEAKRQLELAELSDRNHPQITYMAGQLALLQGDLARAIGLLNLAAREQPTNAQIFASLAAAFLQQGHFAFAEQSLRKALELEPALTLRRRMLVEALLSQDRNEDAAAELAIFRKQHPLDHGGLTLQGELHMRSGQPAVALAEFRNALKQNPRAQLALAGLERALVAIGDPAMSREAWDGVLENDTGLEQVWLARLFTSGADEDFGDVVQRWHRALPDSDLAKIYLAGHEARQGRYADAEARYVAVLERLPAQFDALLGKGAMTLHREPAASLGQFDALLVQASPAQAMLVRAMRARAFDQIGRTADAIADWLPAANSVTTRPSEIPLPPANANALVSNLPTESPATRVVMLWGGPGGGVERIAEVLRTASGRSLLHSARGAIPREPVYPEPFVERGLDLAGLPGVANEIAPVYARMLEPQLARGRHGIFDWVAQWDARMVPALRHAVAGIRLIAVIRDPRDMLLNWLAFGSRASLQFGDPVSAAGWLASQFEHLLQSRDELGLPMLIVDMDRFDADPLAWTAQIAAFSELASAPDPHPASRMQFDTWRLPTRFPAGHWRTYAEPLHAAFAQLASVAERLGYAQD